MTVHIPRDYLKCNVQVRTCCCIFPMFPLVKNFFFFFFPFFEKLLKGL